MGHTIKDWYGNGGRRITQATAITIATVGLLVLFLMQHYALSRIAHVATSVDKLAVRVVHIDSLATHSDSLATANARATAHNTTLATANSAKINLLGRQMAAPKVIVVEQPAEKKKR